MMINKVDCKHAVKMKIFALNQQMKYQIDTAYLISHFSRKSKVSKHAPALKYFNECIGVVEPGG